VLTDNGSPYRSSVHAIACRLLNGKAERFIRALGSYG
jgi:transposase InsO family protein